MNKRILVLLIGYFFSNHSLSYCTLGLPKAGLAECNYDAYTVWLSCKHNAAILSWTSINKDIGSKNTSSRNYKLDETAALINCQQTSRSAYSSVNDTYDVGHLISIDLFDDDKSNALQTNFMTNMVPQNKGFNRHGAWKKTESLTECYRDEEGFAPLFVLAGVIWGNDVSNDHFSQSHGLPKTPDYLWKLLYSESKNEYDAWIMKNDEYSDGDSLSSARRTLDTLILVLETQRDADYEPVLKKLKKIISASPVIVELKWNSNCHRRIG